MARYAAHALRRSQYDRRLTVRGGGKTDQPSVGRIGVFRGIHTVRWSSRSTCGTADYQRPNINISAFLLQGEIDFPTAANDQRTWHTETGEVLVYRSDSSYLNLDPLFVYLHADEIDKSKLAATKDADELYPVIHMPYFTGLT